MNKSQWTVFLSASLSLVPMMLGVMDAMDMLNPITPGLIVVLIMLIGFSLLAVFFWVKTNDAQIRVWAKNKR